MERIQFRFAAVVLLAVLSASMCVAAEHGGGVSGTVRDEHGVPQMGAVVELIRSGRGDVRTVVTGLDGQYLFNDLLTGTYRLRASASFFRPVSTRGLRVGTGVQAVVNLTLANIYSAGTLLPVERRMPNEASDDWIWTMRSAASRPVLRLAGGVAGQAEGGTAGRVKMPITMSIGVHSRSFGGVGAEQTVAAGFQSNDETRAATGLVRTGSSAGAVAVRMTAERRSSPWSSISTAVAFESNPAVRPVSGGTGWRSMRLASAETASFGDTAAVEVGSMLVSDASQPGMPASRPFGRVRVFLPGAWTVEYAMATDRSLQRAADAGGAPTAASRNATAAGQGISRIEHGRHQAVLLSRQSKSHSLTVGYYRDGLERTPVLGSGSATTLPRVLQNLSLLPGALVDGSTGMFRAEGPGYTTEGCHMTVSQQMAPDTWVELRFADGAALELPEAGSLDLRRGLPIIRVGHGVTAGVTTHSRVRKTGTMVRASYQWQPERMITPIDAFDAVNVPAYLGFTVQQDVSARLAPRGTVVRVSAGNVLRQGLRKVLADDQNVATLAQELPTLEAGIGFTF